MAKMHWCCTHQKGLQIRSLATPNGHLSFTKTFDPNTPTTRRSKKLALSKLNTMSKFERALMVLNPECLKPLKDHRYLVVSAHFLQEAPCSTCRWDCKMIYTNCPITSTIPLYQIQNVLQIIFHIQEEIAPIITWQSLTPRSRKAYLLLLCQI